MVRGAMPRENPPAMARRAGIVETGILSKEALRSHASCKLMPGRSELLKEPKVAGVDQ
jgi:hypothetical protein